MTIFMWAAQSNRFEVCVLQHKPLGSLLLKIYLDARMRAIALEVENDALAELAVTHAGTQAHATLRSLLAAADADHRPGSGYPGPDFLQQLFGNFPDEPRRSAVGVHAVQAPLLCIRDVEV